MKITGDELKRLQAIQAKQNQNAMILGVATVEYEDRKRQIIESVNKTRLEQKMTGEQILKGYGLYDQKRDFMIDLAGDGEIKELIDGEYVTMDGKKTKSKGLTRLK